MTTNMYITNATGGCIVTHHGGEFIIDSLIVFPNFRNKGNGTDILKYAEDTVAKLGGKCAFVMIENGFPWIHDWLKRMGYVDYDIYNYPHEEFFIKMTKEL